MTGGKNRNRPKQTKKKNCIKAKVNKQSTNQVKVFSKKSVYFLQISQKGCRRKPSNFVRYLSFHDIFTFFLKITFIKTTVND